jgi:parvulin-like peptidyl-prolyl isomerase
MVVLRHFCWSSLFVGLCCAAVVGQEKPPVPTPGAPPPGPAATVNGQPISETAVQRALKGVPPAHQAEARSEILNHLIDTVLLDQYLLQMRIEVSQKEIDGRLEQVRAEIKKGGQTFEKVMQELMLTEEELRTQLTAELRWEKYVNQQAPDKVLRDFFTKNPEMFDGSMVRARHILLTPAAKDAAAGEQAKSQLLRFRQQVNDEAAKALDKLAAEADNLTREKVRRRAVDDAFVALAHKESSCPSKEQGGDLNWFPRVGSMVEPFAKAAFALKPYEMSDPVNTPFGWHLILVTDRRPGQETKFEDIQEVVKDVYAARLREYVCAQLRPKAKIVTPAKP